MVLPYFKGHREKNNNKLKILTKIENTLLFSLTKTSSILSSLSHFVHWQTLKTIDLLISGKFAIVW